MPTLTSILIVSFAIMQSAFALVEWELFKQCMQYSSLTKGRWIELYGKEWYLHQTSCKLDQMLRCVRFRYSGGDYIQEKETSTWGIIKGEHTRYLKNFYLLKITNSFAATLECVDFGIFYINKLHILTTTGQPINNGDIDNFVRGVLNENGLLFTMNNIDQNCD